MLSITIPAGEAYDEKNECFIPVKETELELEHSLISLSKWESKWHKPFLTNKEKTYEETLDYIRCMALNKKVDPNVYLFLTEENIKAINDYIYDPMTATTIHEEKTGRNHETVTSELIYYWMIEIGIPPEYQKWHLNRLMTLIRVCNVKRTPPKKMSKRDIMSRNAALNAARRKQFNSKG